VAELDRRVIARGKYDLDVTGHYARPDIFKLAANTTVRKAVVFEDGDIEPLA
jgi:nitrilase